MHRALESAAPGHKRKKRTTKKHHTTQAKKRHHKRTARAKNGRFKKRS
jgi:hypothetical protein